MTGLVRRGGRGTLPDGARLTWSVAEGGRGRRWRSVTVDADGALRGVVLLETGLDGRPDRLEVGSGDGLLTLHPGHDGEGLFGNVVTSNGIRHVAMPWSPRHELLVDDAPIVAMAAAGRLAKGIPVGAGRDLPVVRVGPMLEIREEPWRYERPGQGCWRLTGGERSVEIGIAADGLPDGLGEAETWPLER